MSSRQRVSKARKIYAHKKRTPVKASSSSPENRSYSVVAAVEVAAAVDMLGVITTVRVFMVVNPYFAGSFAIRPAAIIIGT
jgi:hypothetical protein